MAADTVQEQILKHLTDVHSTEEHAISMLEAGVESAQDPQLVEALRSLKAVAEHAADSETVALAERILAQEQAAADTLDGLIEQAALTGLPQSTNA